MHNQINQLILYALIIVIGGGFKILLFVFFLFFFSREKHGTGYESNKNTREKEERKG